MLAHLIGVMCQSLVHRGKYASEDGQPFEDRWHVLPDENEQINLAHANGVLNLLLLLCTTVRQPHI